jgi:hypothetical protein
VGAPRARHAILRSRRAAARIARPLNASVRCHVSPLAKSLFGISLGALTFLICLRIAIPKLVVGENVGYLSNAIWALSFTSGLAEWRGMFALKTFLSARALAAQAIVPITAGFIYVLCGYRPGNRSQLVEDHSAIRDDGPKGGKSQPAPKATISDSRCCHDYSESGTAIGPTWHLTTRSSGPAHYPRGRASSAPAILRRPRACSARVRPLNAGVR